MLSNTQKLLAIMAQLRHPETGCPWDIKQNFASLIPYLIEEAYEVIDAIERDDLQNLREELGDLLLQIIFHSQIASERGLFTFDQVAQTLAEKLVRRHPHVFADAIFEDDAQRHAAWESAKREERKDKNPAAESVLAGVARSLPALIECEKIQDRAAQHGFDWQTIEPVFEKVLEELGEVKDAWQAQNQPHIQEEIGDLLLVVVNLARHLNVHPEMALKQSTQKFIKRFHYIEKQVAVSGRSLEECSLAELDFFWNSAKQMV
jgi:MazG family protein